MGQPPFFVLHFYVQHDRYPAQTVGFHMKWHTVLSHYLDHWKVCRSILHAHIQPAPLKRIRQHFCIEHYKNPNHQGEDVA